MHRSDGRAYCSSDEETDDAEPLDHDYNLPQVKGKKVVNRGKWTKEEVIFKHPPHHLPLNLLFLSQLVTVASVSQGAKTSKRKD